MSRSNPNDTARNPAQRWLTWNAQTGSLSYFDKAQEKTVDVGSDFPFVLLDELSTVRGWHDASKSRIFANEVRDVGQDTLVVRAFKAHGTLVEGIYRDIKDRVHTLGAAFATSLYVAFKDGGELKLGCIQLKGSSLGAWLEFRKQHRAVLLTKGIRVRGHVEGKKGNVTFRVPVFQIVELSEASNQAALALDMTLQQYLTQYFTQTRRAQVEVASQQHEEEPPPPADDDTYEAVTAPPLTDDDIPF